MAGQERHQEFTVEARQESKAEKEPTLSLEKLDSVFRERPELIKKIVKCFSRHLRHAFENDFERQTAMGRDNYVIPYGDQMYIRNFQEYVTAPPRFRKEEREKWQSDRSRILGKKAKERSLAELVINVHDTEAKDYSASYRISFVFSVDKKTAKRYWDKGPFGHFTSTEDVEFHGMHIGRRKEQRIPLSEATEDEKFSNLKIGRKFFEDLIKELDMPLNECPEAIEEIERLGEELGIDKEKIKKFRQAVQEFATYAKPEPETDKQCFAEIGRCFTVPYTFSDFCKECFNLDMSQDFYEQSYAGKPTFYHQVNLLDEKMVVDWTARQYRDFNDEPYPFIYPVGDPKLKSWGPLRGLEWKKEKAKKRENQ